MATPKHSVLLVDDEPEILFSLRGLLRREFELYTAESGAQALEILRQHPVQDESRPASEHVGHAVLSEHQPGRQPGNVLQSQQNPRRAAERRQDAAGQSIREC